MQVEMVKKWSNKDIEAAIIAAAFSQLGYPVVKAELLEAAREFVKGQDVFISIPTGIPSMEVQRPNLWDY